MKNDLVLPNGIADSPRRGHATSWCKAAAAGIAILLVDYHATSGKALPSGRQSRCLPVPFFPGEPACPQLWGCWAVIFAVVLKINTLNSLLCKEQSEYGGDNPIFSKSAERINDVFWIADKAIIYSIRTLRCNTSLIAIFS